MAENTSDQGAKDKVKKGMAEAGSKATADISAGTSGPSGRPDRPRDEAAIDDAVDDSFPASDPPAWTSETGAGAPKGTRKSEGQ